MLNDGVDARVLRLTVWKERPLVDLPVETDLRQRPLQRLLTIQERYLHGIEV